MTDYKIREYNRQSNGTRGPLEPGHPDCCAVGHYESQPDPACEACAGTIADLRSDLLRDYHDEHKRERAIPAKERSMGKHTREPWEIRYIRGAVGDCQIMAADGSGREVCTVPVAESSQEQDAADAARIVDCVNACVGIANPLAVRELIERSRMVCYADENLDRCIRKLRAALADVLREGGEE